MEKITDETSRDLASIGLLLSGAHEADLDAAFSTAELQLRALLASPELAAVLAAQIQLAAAPRPLLARAEAGEVVLVDTADVRASLGEYGTSSQYLHTAPVRGVYCVLGGGPLLLRRYALPENWRNDVFTKGMRLHPLGETALGQGAMVRVDGAREVLQFVCTAPVALAKLVAPLNMVQRWAFDATSLRSVWAECADSRIDGLRHAVEVLRSMGSRHSTTGLLCMTHHRAHFVRWEGIRALMYVDRDAGIRRLRAAVADRHPDVRIAAAAALERLQHA